METRLQLNLEKKNKSLSYMKKERERRERKRGLVSLQGFVNWWHTKHNKRIENAFWSKILIYQILIPSCAKVVLF